jgi:hypothetical protein
MGHQRHPSHGGGGAAVASVHHRRVISNTSDTSFLAGLFAGDTDLSNVTTSTATLHRRVFSGGASLDDANHNKTLAHNDG